MLHAKPLKTSANRASMSTDAHQHPRIVGEEVICEGWVLKRKRKMMQGFARRYFTLYQSGLLCYSFEPGQPHRDQIALPTAAISTARGRKDIHVDSNTATFHIKCLTTEDFERWMAAFRRFVAPPEGQTLGRKSSVSKALPALHLARTSALAEELGSTIAELEDAFMAFTQEESKKKSGKSGFGLFKKGGSNNHDTSSESGSSQTQPPENAPQHRLQSAISSLKSQHASLVKSINNLSPGDATVRNSSLPSTTEEDVNARTPTARTPSQAPWTPGSSSGFSKRTSVAETVSEGSRDSMWFDAPEADDGAQEYVLEDPGAREGEEGTSKFTPPASQSSLDLGVGEDSRSEDDDEVGESPALTSVDSTTLSGKEIVRRTQLPSKPIGDEGSLFAVLKKNVGKDLSSVALPVTFNEPLTLLQRAAEEVEYYDLLTQAASTSDSVERMCYVAAFAVSSYAHTRHRSGRKGFNPLLAETFENVRMKFLAEKVSHHPVIMAYHAEGEGWDLCATSSGKTKFWGKSLEIIPVGVTRVRIGDDCYEWKKPSSFMRNLMMGTKYLEHCGKMVIENTSTKAKCILDFKESGYWASANTVSGTVMSSNGSVQTELEGKWDDSMAQKIDASHLKILWRIHPFPKNAPEYYGFTSFGITLNEITPDLEGRLPPTDSRYRPDVRALEEGDLDRAEKEKLRVEEMQRERRRAGKEVQPRWFRKVKEDDWAYTGGYWEERSKGWHGVEPLW